MKILFLMHSMAVGGTQRQLTVLCRELLRRGHEVTVLLHYTGEPLDAELQERGVHVIDLNKRGRWHNVGFLIRLIRAVRAEQPDVVYAHLALPNLLALLLRYLGDGCAVVCGVRASDMSAARTNWPLMLSLRLERKLVLHADVVIVNSQTGARHLCRGKQYDHVVVIENGLEPERFLYDERGRSRKRTSWHVAADTPVVGCVARLDPMKDHATLLQAFALLRQSHSDARLICVGTLVEPYFSELRDLTRRMRLDEVVRWIDHESDLSPVYSGFDALCLSSAYGEGFSNVLAEAMACGVPCVATDVGDASRILSSADYLVPPRDPDALAGALAASLAQGRTFSELRTEKIRREFSVRNLADKTEAALAAAMRRRNLRLACSGVRGGLK
jgi:glycosyltransferase involved in cell wall biosynthesis